MNVGDLADAHLRTKWDKGELLTDGDVHETVEKVKDAHAQ